MGIVTDAGAEAQGGRLHQVTLELAASLLAKAPTAGAGGFRKRKGARKPAVASITGVLLLIEGFQRPFQERRKAQPPSFSRRPIG
jgi:hypothetical protein